MGAYWLYKLPDILVREPLEICLEENPLVFCGHIEPFDTQRTLVIEKFGGWWDGYRIHCDLISKLNQLIWKRGSWIIIGYMSYLFRPFHKCIGKKLQNSILAAFKARNCFRISSVNYMSVKLCNSERCFEMGFYLKLNSL